MSVCECFSNAAACKSTSGEGSALFLESNLVCALSHSRCVSSNKRSNSTDRSSFSANRSCVGQVLQTSSKRLNQAAAEAAAVEFTGRHRQRRAEQNGAHPTAMRCSFVSNSRLSSFLVGICRHLDSTLGSVSFCSRSSTLACTAASCSCAQTNETSRVQVPFRQCMEQSSRGRERERDVH